MISATSFGPPSGSISSFNFKWTKCGLLHSVKMDKRWSNKKCNWKSENQVSFWGQFLLSCPNPPHTPHFLLVVDCCLWVVLLFTPLLLSLQSLPLFHPEAQEHNSYINSIITFVIQENKSNKMRIVLVMFNSLSIS